MRRHLVNIRGTDCLVARDFSFPAARIYISKLDFLNGTLGYISFVFNGILTINTVRSLT